MGISEDLAAVFDEIGTEFSVVGTTDTEKLDIAVTDKVGIFTVTLRSATVISQGSLILEINTGKNYLVYSIVPEQFENTEVVKNCRAFLCTNTAKIQKLNSTKDPVTRKEIISFSDLETVPCYTVSPNTGNGLNSEFDNVLFSESVLRVVLKTSAEVNILTRILVDGVKFQVSSVDTVRFPGLLYLELAEDIR